jgi:AcrR family transcriptional regulator
MAVAYTVRMDKSTRSRRKRGSLNRDAILDAAEGIASAAGFDALSMRAVAAALDAAPMALYRHFATKQELVSALLDRVLGRFEPNPPTDDWREDLRRFAQRHRRLLEKHPWALIPLFTNPSPGLNATKIGEHALEILKRGGLSDAGAVAGFSGVVALNYGWTAFTAGRDTAAAGVEEALEALPPEAFPLTKAVAKEMAAYGSEGHYDLVLTAFAPSSRA